MKDGKMNCWTRRAARTGCGAWLARVATLALLACSAAHAPAGAAGEVMVDGVPHVRNGARPSGGTQTLRLQERWRAGGEGSDLLFGLVGSTTADADGNIYVLDRQLCQVHVFAPDGRLLRTMGREGDGPGEFRFPTGVVVLPDGRVGVSRTMPGSIVLLTRDGTPAGTIRIGGDAAEGSMLFLDEVLLGDEQLVVSGRSLHRSDSGIDRKMYASIVDLNGKELVRLLEKGGSDPITTRRYVERDEYWVSRGGMAAGRDGRVYLAQERDRYAIWVYTPDGKVERVIEREIQPRKRTDEEKTRVGEGMVAIVNGERIRFEIVPEEYPPRVQGMTAMPNGELWVVSAPETDALPAGILQAYDVFSPTGEYARRVHLAGPGDADTDRVILLGPDRLLVIQGFVNAARAMVGDGQHAEGESQPLEVVYYTLVAA